LRRKILARAPEKTLAKMTTNAISKTQRADKPIVVSMLSVIFIVCGTICARGGAPLPAARQLHGEYQYARLAVRKPTRNVITEFGRGSVRLQGTADSLRLEVHDSTIATVLAVMGRAFNVQFRSSTALDDPITGTYAGSLTRVIARILDGYDYAIMHEGPAVEVAVFGRSRGRAEPAPPTPAMVAPTTVAPAAVAPVRRVLRCGRSAGHRAACPPI
jgi:hypothetical protein